MGALSSFYKKIMMARQLSYEEGVYTVLGKRLVMTPAMILTALQDVLVSELKGRVTAPLLYKMGYEAGLDWMHAYISGLKLRDSTKALEFAIEFSNSSGWGKTELISRDYSTLHLKLHTINSPFIACSKSENNAVCHILRGLYAGSGEAIFNKKMGGIETRCQTIGEKYCEFVFKPLHEFDLTKTVISQLPLEELLDEKVKYSEITNKEKVELLKKYS